MIIRRYLLREISHTFFAITLVILLIAISNKLVRLIAHAASGDIAPKILLEMILFQIPDLVAFLLPVGLFLAILLCMGRFFVENEIPVMLACGISWQRFVLICTGLGLVIMVVTATLTCYWGPQLAQYREQLLQEEGPLLLVETVSPGRFHSFNKDRLVFYVADLSTDRKELKHIFIAEQPKSNSDNPEKWGVVTAKAGNVVTDKQTDLTYFTLIDGKRFDGIPGENNYNIVAFDKYQRLLESRNEKAGLYYHRTMPTKMLLQDPSKGNLAELQWRISLPLSAPLLAFLAVPLSRVSPRRGRYGQLFFAVIICVIYYNLLTMSKRWIAMGVIPPHLGVWWVHLLLFFSAAIFLAKISGRWHQFYHALKQQCKSYE